MVEAGAEELGDFPLLAAIRDHFAIREAMLRAQLGDREQAARLMSGGGNGPETLGNAVVIAQFQLADGDAEVARETLAPWSGRAHRDAWRACRPGWSRRSRSTPPSDHDGAAESLERALDLAEPGGLRWALVQFGRPLQPLLARQLRRGHRAPRAGRRAAGGARRQRRPQPGQARRSMVEPLSPREQAVLRYLPTMMSNQEIASELFVSVNTVKTHLKAIYRKLDVADRREAVRRARRLELLAP